jgi:putative Holliday junction resolvase
MRQKDMFVERVLALDVGRVRIGVAMSDPMGMIAQPFEVIDRRKTQVMQRIAEIVAQYEVRTLVVGRPLTLSGDNGLAVEATEAFVGALAKWVSLPVHWCDERLSTAQAQRLMIDGGVRRDKRRTQIDKVAAALILQSYLDSRPASSVDGAI